MHACGCVCLVRVFVSMLCVCMHVRVCMCVCVCARAHMCIHHMIKSPVALMRSRNGSCSLKGGQEELKKFHLDHRIKTKLRYKATKIFCVHSIHA